ncbi:MAG: glycosyltransferase family 4 protein [bacterium]
MNIILLNYEYPPLGGGAGNACKAIAENLVKEGHNIKVYTTSYKNLSENEIINGVEIIRVPGKRKRVDRSRLIELFHYHKHVLKHSRDIIHFKPAGIIAFFGIPSGYTAMKLNKMAGIPYIVSLRGADVPGFFCSRKVDFLNIFLKPVHKSIWKNAKAVAANSRGLKKLADRFIKIEIRIEVIPNGVDTAFYSPGSPKDFSCKLLFAGRMSRQKGCGFLIKALALIKEKNWHLTMVGDGPELEKWKDLAEKNGIANKIKWKGWLARESLLNEYRNADIFVFPSYDEGMPNAMLEAMACGLPVIASRVSGVEELVEDNKNGWLFESGDLEELSVSLERCLNTGDRINDFSENSRNIARRFSWENCANRYCEILSGIKI